MKHVLSLLLALPGLATAADFDTRVAQARSAIATRDGYAYDLALVPAIHAAMVGCVPSGRAPAAKSDLFTTVASVDHAGRVSGVEVRPVTPVARCFARRLTATRLQAPPRAARFAAGYPILIRLRETF